MTNRRISETLEIRGRGGEREICCRRCGNALAPAGTGWKPHARLTAVPVALVPGATTAVHPEVVFRRFCCPRCASLLDSETALPGDPFLEDIVLV